MGQPGQPRPLEPAGGARPGGSRSGPEEYGGTLRQLYPPLGFAPDGTPLFWPGQQTPHPGARRPDDSGRQAPDQDRTTASADDDSPPAPQSRPRRTTDTVPTVRSMAITAAALAAAVILVVLVAIAFLRAGPDQDSTTAADLPTFTTETFTRIPTTGPRLTPSRPDRSTPRSPAGIDPAGKQITYQVTIEGTATILYVDAAGLRTEFAPPATWKYTFTGSYNPLRLIVVVGSGSTATCTITVDGRAVVNDEVGPTSAKRSASCIA